MNLLLTVILFLLTGISSFAQQALPNGPPTAFGPVKTITYRYYSVSFSQDKIRIDEGVSNGRNVVWLFNPKGKVLTSEIYEMDGRSSQTKSVYAYDNSDRLTSITHYLFGRLSYTETFTYPAERHVKITRVFEPPMGSTEIQTDEYDKAGRITKATFEDEERTWTESYKYDDAGNPIEYVTIDVSGKQLVKETYQYEFDRYGNWTERRSNVVAAPHLGIPPKTTITRKLTYY